LAQRRWHIQGIGDFNAGGKSDIVWRNVGGTTVLSEMDGGRQAGSMISECQTAEWPDSELLE
jgi:hypothetical protein